MHCVLFEIALEQGRVKRFSREGGVGDGGARENGKWERNKGRQEMGDSSQEKGDRILSVIYTVG